MWTSNHLIGRFAVDFAHIEKCFIAIVVALMTNGTRNKITGSQIESSDVLRGNINIAATLDIVFDTEKTVSFRHYFQNSGRDFLRPLIALFIFLAVILLRLQGYEISAFHFRYGRNFRNDVFFKHFFISDFRTFGTTGLLF